MAAIRECLIRIPFDRLAMLLGLPPGMTIRAALQSELVNNLTLKVEDVHFKPIEEGEPIPWIKIEEAQRLK